MTPDRLMAAGSRLSIGIKKVPSGVWTAGKTAALVAVATSPVTVLAALAIVPLMNANAGFVDS